VNTSKRDNGSTALTCATQGGHLEVVRELCRKGADVNVARKNDGMTPLMVASRYGYLEIVRELHEKGAK